RWKGYCQRNRGVGGGDRPIAGLDFFARCLPRIESLSLGATHAVPLNLPEVDLHRDAGDNRALVRYCDDRGVEAALLIDEVRWREDPDVPGRRMDHEACSAGDVLP